MDNSNIDFSNLWKQQKVGQPNRKELEHKLNQFRKSGIRKLIVSNILLLSTSGFIIYIWIYYQPQYLSSKIGIVLVILAMAIFLFAYNKLFSIFNRIDSSLTNKEYLKNLMLLKTKQKHIQTTMSSLYFMMLSLGLCLYMYEYTSRMTLFWAVFAYGITLAWIGFNWFYIRPKTIKKQQAKLNELIDKVEKVSKQLREE